MILTYIKKPTAIILAVTAANTDLTNSDAVRACAGGGGAAAASQLMACRRTDGRGVCVCVCVCVCV